MLQESLTKEMNPEQYAEWVYDYRRRGFFQKVPFKKWCDRMHKIGISFRFWKKYKQLKGESEEDLEDKADQYEADHQAGLLNDT